MSTSSPEDEAHLNFRTSIKFSFRTVKKEERKIDREEKILTQNPKGNNDNEEVPNRE